MKNLSPLGLLSCFVFSMFLNGASINNTVIDRIAFDHKSESSAYVINHSHSTIYYKPESKEANPGLDPDGAYPIAPGQTLYAPVDAVVTPAISPGKIYRIPTGAKIIVNEYGIPEPANLIAKAGLLVDAYGNVNPNCANFAKLANSKQVLYQLADISHP